MIGRSLVVVIAMLGSAHAEIRSTGPLGIRVRDGLVLGRDTTVEVRLHATPGIVLVTHVGTLSSPTPVGDDLVATLALPTERHPQVAIIAAVGGDGSVVDWLAVPLAGQARMKVTTAPRATVNVVVAGATFGPVTADSRGNAEVPIVVPPGVDEAKTLATTAIGGTTTKTVPLGTRAFRRVLAICSPFGDRVTTIATALDGSPSAVPPNLVSSSGTLGLPTERGPGVFEAALEPSSNGVMISITATLVDDNLAARCKVLIPETPIELTAVADRATFVAGSGPITLRITSASLPAIDVDSGTLTAPIRDGLAWTARWTLPDALAARRVARARVSAKQQAREIAVRLQPAAAARLEATAPGPLRADGVATAAIVVRAFDRFGNDAALPRLRSRGHGTVVVNGALVTYRAPRSRSLETDTVTLIDDASGVSTTLAVRLEPLLSRLHATPSVGVLANLGRITTPIATATAGGRLPLLGDRLVVEASVGFYSTNLDTMSVSGRLTSVPLIARIAYCAPLGPVEVWGGAGFGAIVTSTTVSSSSTGLTRDGGVHLAATAFGGVGRVLGPGRLVGELAYLHATTDGSVSGRIGGVVATAGYRLELR